LARHNFQFARYPPRIGIHLADYDVNQELRRHDTAIKSLNSPVNFSNFLQSQLLQTAGMRFPMKYESGCPQVPHGTFASILAEIGESDSTPSRRKGRTHVASLP
jgi:hypothetical protein